MSQFDGQGRELVANNMFPAGTILYLAGQADDPVLGRGKGEVLEVSSDSAGDTSIDIDFNDSIWIGGGGAIWKGAVWGDYFSLSMFAPATPVVPNGGNTGNCNVVGGVIIPAAGDGAYDVDLATAVPIPQVGGPYKWSDPETGKGVVTVEANGGYILVAADVPLAQFAVHVTIMDDGHESFTIPAIQAKQVFPQWKLRFTLHNGGHAGLKFAFYLTTARYDTR